MKMKKNKMNAFYWDGSILYYIRHPIRFMRHFIRNLNNAYSRIVRGYCKSDYFNLDSWLITLLPQMLREIKNSPVGAYPGIKPFETPEKWHEWLETMALNFESIQNNWAEVKNEYDGEYWDIFHNYVETYGNICQAVENGPQKSAQDYLKEVQEKWLARAQELDEQQQAFTENLFLELSKHLYQLWI